MVLSVVVTRAAVIPGGKVSVLALPLVPARPTLPVPAQSSPQPGLSNRSYAFCSASSRIVATSAGARLSFASLVVTSTFPLVVARFPCTVLPSPRSTWTGLSALTDSTWSQDVVTTPKWSVLMVRFLPSFLMMLPVTRSPFFITTWSAHAALTARQTSKDKDRILILLSIIVGHALCWSRSLVGNRLLQASCEVQCGQRVAGIGIGWQQNLQSFVVGAAGAAGAGRHCRLLAVFTTRKITNATMRKLITVLRNCPYAITGAAAALAAAMVA